MSEQYGGPWNNPAGGTPGPDPAQQGQPGQGYPALGYPDQPGHPDLSEHPAETSYSAPPDYATAPPYPGAQGQPGVPGYPAQAYGYAAPGSYPGVPPVRNDYAPWAKRVGAYLIDFLPALLGAALFYVGYGIALFASVNSAGATVDLGAGAGWMIVGGILAVLGQVWTIFNRWITAGRTGQSMGKRVAKIVLIGEDTSAPIGALNAFLRDLLHILDGFAYVGYLWPLWDERKQTFSDKIMKTAVIKAPSTTA